MTRKRISHNRFGLAEETVMKFVLFALILALLVFLLLYVFGPKLQETARGIPWV